LLVGAANTTNVANAEKASTPLISFYPLDIEALDSEALDIEAAATDLIQTDGGQASQQFVKHSANAKV
jgi:hypothetical protein